MIIQLQRGRAPESAEWAKNVGKAIATNLLQRGRAPESAEWMAPAWRTGWSPVLQRGRAPESAECAKEGIVVLAADGLQRGRAPESAECVYENGVGEVTLSFNGAALRRARSGGGGGLGERRAQRFNGAALRRARSGDVAVFGVAPLDASTGPRSGERGVTVEHVGACVTLVALQRGRAPESAEWRKHNPPPNPAKRFNGAALRRARSAPC